MNITDCMQKYNFWKKVKPNSILFRKDRIYIDKLIKDTIEGNRIDSVFNDLSYREIKVYLNRVMFDGLASVYSNGFFDDDDIPPPELWKDFKDSCLIAIIPNEFDLVVDECIRESMSESIEWNT